MVVSIVLGTIGLVALFGTYAISIVSYIRKAIKNTITEKHLRRNIRDRVRDDKRKRKGNKKIMERNTIEIGRIIIQPIPKIRSHIATNSIRYSMPC